MNRLAYTLRFAVLAMRWVRTFGWLYLGEEVGGFLGNLSEGGRVERADLLGNRVGYWELCP